MSTNHPPASYPAPPGMTAYPPSPQYVSSPYPLQRTGARSVLVVGALAIAVLAVFGAGVGGVALGAHLNRAAPSAPPAPSSSTPAPTQDQVRAATVDLCTRFAAGYRAMPSPQISGFDVIPTINYIAAALADTPSADGAVREAATNSLKLLRQHAAALSGEAPRGAIQPPMEWTAAQANQADQRVWDLCRAYGG